MAHLKYATINLSKSELKLLQDLISKEKNNLSNRITSENVKEGLSNILKTDYDICRDLNIVFKDEINKIETLNK